MRTGRAIRKHSPGLFPPTDRSSAPHPDGAEWKHHSSRKQTDPRKPESSRPEHAGSGHIRTSGLYEGKDGTDRAVHSEKEMRSNKRIDGPSTTGPEAREPGEKQKSDGGNNFLHQIFPEGEIISLPVGPRFDRQTG